jgi:chromosome segregation ATPase
MFRTVFRDILDRLDRLDARLDRVERSLDGLRAEPALREQLDRKTRELEALADQGLHIVDRLDEARRRVRELEGRLSGGKES